MAATLPATERLGPNFTINQRWPKLINVELLRSILCQSTEEQILARASELQTRYDDLNCACRDAKTMRDQLLRGNSDNQQTIDLQQEKIQELETNIDTTQSKLEDCKKCVAQCDCEVQLLQNQPAPSLPSSFIEDQRMETSLERLSDDIMDMYSGLLVLRSGQVVLFSDLENIMKDRPTATRNLKQNIRELRKKIREAENAVIALTNEQKKWKGTLREGKRNISRRARQQYLGLKEEAAKLKRTIELFQEERIRLSQATRDFENALNTSIGEKDLAELMEHFEPLLRGQNGLLTSSDSPFGGNGAMRNLFRGNKMATSPSFLRGRTTMSGSAVDASERVCRLHRRWLESAATKLKAEANLLRAGFDIALLETSLTAESYYDSQKTDEERRRGYRAMVSAVASDELLNVRQDDLAEYFDPEVKFPGRNTCLAQPGPLTT